MRERSGERVRQREGERAVREERDCVREGERERDRVREGERERIERERAGERGKRYRVRRRR